MLQGENSREVAHRVGQRIEEISASLPPGVVIRPELDRTELVEATIRTVEHNLALGALLVIAVLFFALGNVRAALITALAQGRIRGAGLDVHDLEPLPVDHPLRSAPRTVLTPHLGYVTEDTYRIFFTQAVEDIAAWAAGEPVRVLG